MKKELVIVLPNIYGIICDKIKGRPLSIFNKEDKKIAIRASNFLGIRIDPHIDNYMFEETTGKLVVVDTEHFPTVLGLKRPLYYKSYFSWYRQLAFKFCEDKLWRTKKARRDLQKQPEAELVVC